MRDLKQRDLAERLLLFIHRVYLFLYINFFYTPAQNTHTFSCIFPNKTFVGVLFFKPTDISLTHLFGLLHLLGQDHDNLQPFVYTH